MATFTYLNPTNNTCNTPISESDLTRLTFSRNSRPIIYANYPEIFGKNNKGYPFAANGWCINRQTVTPGEAHIFYSHWNTTDKTIKYRIQIYNMSSETATINRSNCGFYKGWEKPGQAVEDFFNSSNYSFNVLQGASAWLTDEYSINAGQPFTGMIRFNTTKTVSVTIYSYESISDIDGYEKIYPYGSEYASDEAVYTGIGEGYFLTASHGTIEIDGDFPYKYMTNEGLRNSNEITPIELAGTNPTLVAKEDAQDEKLRNLGNWCTQNYHTITIKNNTSTTKTVYGYIGSNNLGNSVAVLQGMNIKSVKLESTPRRWKWCKLVLSAGESYTFDFQTILPSFGNAATLHEWDIVDYMV